MEVLEWETGCYGNRHLSGTSEPKLRRAVIEEKRRDWEFRLKNYRSLDRTRGYAHWNGCPFDPALRSDCSFQMRLTIGT